MKTNDPITIAKKAIVKSQRFLRENPMCAEQTMPTNYHADQAREIIATKKEELKTLKASDKKWADGRPKVWFELYCHKQDLDSSATLAGCLKVALAFKSQPKESLSIYEVHSMGGWNTNKQDKITKVYKVVGKKAVQRPFVKGW